MAILMNMVAQPDILERVPGLLEELLGQPVRRVDQPDGVDLLVSVGPHVFAVAAKSDSRAGSVSRATESARAAAAAADAQAVALVVVPFMGDVGRVSANRRGSATLTSPATPT